MPLLQVDVCDLPESPLDAAADFYATRLPRIRGEAEETPAHDLVLVFASAGHEHCAWRLAAVQELARAFAPRRVNGIVGGDDHAIVETIGFLEGAQGITGQLLPVEASAAGNLGI